MEGRGGYAQKRSKEIEGEKRGKRNVKKKLVNKILNKTISTCISRKTLYKQRSRLIVLPSNISNNPERQ